MQTKNDMQTQNRIASLTKDNAFMLSVGELAVLQVGIPKKELAYSYHKEIEEQKRKIIENAIAQGTMKNGSYFQRVAIDSVKKELVMMEYNQAINERNTIANFFTNVANSDKNNLEDALILEELEELEALEELDKLTQQEEAKAKLATEITLQLPIKQILEMPEVKAKYDECVGLLREDMRPKVDSMFLKTYCKGDITKDTVLPAIQETKEKIDTRQNNKIAMAINSSPSVLLDEECNVGGEQDIREQIKSTNITQIKSTNITTASKGFCAKVSNPNPRSMSQKQQSNQRGGR